MHPEASRCSNGGLPAWVSVRTLTLPAVAPKLTTDDCFARSACREATNHAGLGSLVPVTRHGRVQGSRSRQSCVTVCVRVWP